MGIKNKTLLPLLMILMIAMSGLAGYNYYSQVSLLNREADETLKNTLHSTQNVITERLKQYQQMATLVAGIPTISDAFAKRDRNRLIAEFSGVYETLKREYQLAQFVFHVPPATAFLRVQQREKYGDDVALLRPMVVNVNEKMTAARGIEIGRGGLGLRGTVPVLNRGQHVGSVEFGGELAPAINDARDAFDVEAGVLLSAEATASVWPEWQKSATRVGNQLFFYATNPHLAQALVTTALLRNSRVMQGGMYTERGVFEGRNYYVAVAPLKDYFNRDIGYLCVFKDQTEFMSKINRVLLVNLVMYVLILFVVSGAINFSLKKTVITPLVRLTEEADAISMGDLANKVETDTHDEISTLAKAIDRMRISMKKFTS